jgi:hypothetical protein
MTQLVKSNSYYISSAFFWKINPSDSDLVQTIINLAEAYVNTYSKPSGIQNVTVLRANGQNQIIKVTGLVCTEKKYFNLIFYIEFFLDTSANDSTLIFICEYTYEQAKQCRTVSRFATTDNTNITLFTISLLLSLVFYFAVLTQLVLFLKINEVAFNDWLENTKNEHQQGALENRKNETSNQPSKNIIHFVNKVSISKYLYH